MADGNNKAVQGRNSDLPVRTATALVMVAVAGSAVWLGGWAWALFVALVACGVLWEWRSLASRFAGSPVRLGLWNAFGFLYIAVAAGALLVLRSPLFPAWSVLAVLLAVIATDIGAYFAGRAIGGPKIAPKISPSKTWAGLGGGIVGASLVMLGLFALNDYALTRGMDAVIVPTGQIGFWQSVDWAEALASALPLGAATAIVAQAGDFFESWMKRRAGVKDSGKLLPGHGGLFDRVDGLLSVCFIGGLGALAALALGLA